MKTINYQKIVNLSHIIQPSIPLWPGDPPVEFETVAKLDKDDYYLRKFSMGEHSGTHINAPNTFDKDGISIDQYSPQSLVIPAIVIDFRSQTEKNFDSVLTIADILAWEKKYHQIPSNCAVLLYTGWQEKWDNPQAFLNADTQGKLHFPGFSQDAIAYLLKERKIAGVGIDTHGIDGGKNDSFTTNKLMLKSQSIVLENLTNLDQLPPYGITLVMGILKLLEGSGSPVSVLAFVA